MLGILDFNEASNLALVIAIGLTLLTGMTLIILTERLNRQYKTPAYFLGGFGLVMALLGFLYPFEDAVIGAMLIIIGGGVAVIGSIPFKKENS